MIWLGAHFALVATAVIFTLTWSLVMQERRTPQSTLAWMGFIILLPYAAIPAFLIFGYRKRRNLPSAALPPPGRETGADDLDRLLTGYGVAPAGSGNTFRLLFEGAPAYEAMMELVRGAQESLSVTLYVLGDDEVGRAFCAALAERAAQGVRVRLILDSVGALRRPRAALRSLRRHGAEVRLYSPLLHGPFGGHVNLRNHRKMVIADGAGVWAGGRNVARDYLGPTAFADRWRDLSFTLCGPAAQGFTRLFESDWTAAGAKSPPAPISAGADTPTGTTPLRLVPSGPDTPDDPLHDALVHSCHTARERIWIVTPYFIPTEGLIAALSMAARRGVDVRIALPATSNQRLADLARGAYMRALAADGCRFFMIGGTMVHAKAVLTDARAFVGSANFDARSLLLNFELMVLLESAEHLVELEGWAADLMATADQTIPQSHGLRRLAEAIFRLTSPIL